MSVSFVNAAQHWRHTVDDLSGDQPVAGAHGIQAADIQWGYSAGLREPIHLRLMCNARLNDTEASHCTAGKIVGPDSPPIHNGVVTSIRALGVGHSVDKNSRRC